MLSYIVQSAYSITKEGFSEKIKLKNDNHSQTVAVWRITVEKIIRILALFFLFFSTSFSLLDIFYIFMHF